MPQNLDDRDLRGAQLAGSDFAAASARNACFVRADLAGSDLRSGNFAGSSFVLADLSSAHLEGAALTGCDLRAADLRGAKLLGCDLEGALLHGAALDRNPARASRVRQQANASGYPTFADALEPGTLPYLRLEPVHVHVLRGLEGVQLGSDDFDAELVALLSELDWRLHLVAVTAFAMYGGERATAIAWQMLERRAWLSPQLAAALSLQDPGYSERIETIALDDKAGEAVDDLRTNTPSIGTDWREAIRAFVPTPL